MALSDFGKSVKKRLIDMDRSQEWLASEITARTGLYMDSSYMYKILHGILKSPKVVAAIRETLDLPED